MNRKRAHEETLKHPPHPPILPLCTCHYLLQVREESLVSIPLNLLSQDFLQLEPSSLDYNCNSTSEKFAAKRD